MRTPTEKVNDSINTLKRNMVRIYRNEIEPLFDFLKMNDSNSMTSVDYERFFEYNHSIYANGNQFGTDLIECLDIYWDKLDGGDEIYKRLKNNEYTLSEANLDYELFKKVASVSSELVKYLKQCRSARILTESRKEINKRRNDVYDKIEHAHTYPHNLRPQMSQGRLYGDKIRTPRKKTSPKTKFVCPENMF